MQGNIKQNNVKEIVTYLADEMQQEANPYSRAGRSQMSVNQSHDVSLMSSLPKKHERSFEQEMEHRRKSSISRLLGK